MCILERACWCRCRLKVLLLEWRVRWVVPLQGAAAKCCFGVLLLERRMRCGAGLPVPLQGVDAGCRCRMHLQGAAVRVLRALWSWLAGATAGCGCRVLLCILGTWLLLQGTAVRAARAMKLGCSCRCRRREMFMAVWALCPD